MYLYDILLSMYVVGTMVFESCMHSENGFYTKFLPDVSKYTQRFSVHIKSIFNKKFLHSVYSKCFCLPLF